MMLGKIKISSGCIGVDIRLNNKSISDISDVPPVIRELLSSYYTIGEILSPVSYYRDEDSCDTCGYTYEETVYDVKDLISALEEAIVFLKSQGD